MKQVTTYMGAGLYRFVQRTDVDESEQNHCDNSLPDLDQSFDVEQAQVRKQYFRKHKLGWWRRMTTASAVFVKQQLTDLSG